MNSIGQTGSAAFPFVLGVMAQKVILSALASRCTLKVWHLKAWSADVTAVVSSTLDVLQRRGLTCKRSQLGLLAC
jgi:hypothetical protein